MKEAWPGEPPAGTGALLHQFRLVSLSLPVGSFSYSRGLEGAVRLGWVNDETTAQAWILGVLNSNFAALDGALFWRMSVALNLDQPDRFLEADGWLAAARESRELQLEDRRLAQTLLRLLAELDVRPHPKTTDRVRTYPGAVSLAAHHWSIPPRQALLGLLWNFIETQVMAGVRLVPLGQTAAQRIMIAAVGAIERADKLSRSISTEEIGATGQGLAIASAWHETQYSRLFQS